MFPAAVVTLCSLLAQAEPAPPEPTLVPPARPPATPASPALPVPSPPPDPSPSLPPPPLGSATPPRNGLAVYGRFAYRVGEAGEALGPKAGFSLGGTYERDYLDLPGQLELGGAIDFFYDRFATDATGVTLAGNGQEVPATGTRTLTETSFAALQTIALELGGVRPFAAAGVGLSIAYFSTPEVNLRPGSATNVLPFVRGALGVEIPLRAGVAVVARADYSHALTSPTYTPMPTDGNPSPGSLSFWGDLFDVGGGFVARF